jgi:hypothetical protein
MLQEGIAPLRIAAKLPDPRLPRPTTGWLARWPWLAVGVAIALLAVLFVALTGMQPAYDAYGWLVWGRQALHLNLNTNAAPSWKPLSFLFTLPYALVGRAAVWLWMDTAVAGALAGSVFAGRIAYRLSGGASVPRYAGVAAAIFAGIGVLGIEGYGHFVLIASSDPMIVTLCLAAIDFHLSGRPRLAYAALVLAALGRPEAWLIVAAYAVWMWRARPDAHRTVILGLLAIAALWFVIPGLTSPSWTISGDIAKSSAAPVGGNKFTGVIQRYLDLYELPMQLATLIALILATVRREMAWLVLAAGAAAWLAVEIAFAIHGWPASPRYLFEPAAVSVVLAGAGVGRLLAITRQRMLLRIGGIALVGALVIALVPHARIRARLLHNGIVLGRDWARQIDRLHDVIAREGGTKRILACGRPVTEIPFQTILAWEMGENIVDVGWNPPAEEARDRPMVLFEPYDTGWMIMPIHSSAANAAGCSSLETETPVG